MEIFLVLVGIWAYFTLRGNKEGRRIKAGMRDSMEQAKMAYASEQAAYDQMMAELPEIEGNSHFNVRVNTTKADMSDLENIAAYLELEYTIREPVNAIIECLGTALEGNWGLRVEISQANAGNLFESFNKEIWEKLSSVGGRATCSARLSKSSANQKIQVHLDIDFPINFIQVN